MRETTYSPLMRLLARGLLALAFLCAQQTATLHWLSHATHAAQTKAAHGSAPSEHCDECLALGAFGAAAPAARAVPLPSGGGPVQVTVQIARGAVASLRLAFRSRAPPILA